MNTQHKPMLVRGSELPTSLDQIERVITQAFQGVFSEEQKNDLIKQYFDIWYQNGLPFERHHFENLCKAIWERKIQSRSEKEKRKKRFWWEDKDEI